MNIPRPAYPNVHPQLVTHLHFTSTSFPLQDDNWGETTTAVTGTSELSVSQEEVVGLGKGIQDRTQGFRRYLPLTVGLCAGLVVVATPLVFLLLPAIMWPDRLQACGAACEGLFLSISFKLLILLIAIWALFLRPGRASLPRVCVYRAFLTTLTLLLTMSYWLFYGVRILDAQVGLKVCYQSTKSISFMVLKIKSRVCYFLQSIYVSSRVWKYCVIFRGNFRLFPHCNHL